MKSSKSSVLVMAALLTMFAGFCFAQTREAESDLFNTSTLAYFNREANWKDSSLLFKALYYNAPYPKHYYVLMVYKDGSVLTYRNVPNWAVQNSNRTKLDDVQLEQLKRLIAQISTQEGAVPLEVKAGENHTAFVYLNGETYKRMDFIGELPFDVRQVVSYAKDEAEKNMRSIYESEIK